MDDLASQLTLLGVRSGGVLLLHASFKSLGPVAGGAAAVIEALHHALGPNGTLMMPGFNMASRDKDERAATWNPAKTPSSVGYLTEFFRQTPGTLRSDHYSHSVAARGPLAEWLTSGHLSKEGMVSPWDREPWGRTYGTHSPLFRALDAGAQVLLLGVDCRCLTYIHLAEVIDFNQRRQTDPDAPYHFADRGRVDAWWRSRPQVSSRPAGCASCFLFNAVDFVDALTQDLRRHPEFLVQSSHRG